MRPEEQTEYIVQCVRDSGSMYADDARNFLAEHDAHVRAEVLAEAAVRLLDERAIHAPRAIFCDGITHAANRLSQWATEAGEDQ